MFPDMAAKRRRNGCRLVVLLAATAPGCGGTLAPAPARASQAVATVSPDWPMYGHDLARTSFDPAETQIAVGTVARLAPRFRAFVGIGAVPSASGPVVAGGRVCAGSSVDTGDNYFCFDATTGAPLWSANLGHFPAPGNVGIGSTAAIADGRLIVGGGDSAYYALDTATGAMIWRHPMDAGPTAFAWSSPLVANGLAYVGISGQYASLRGELRALGVADGAVVARQYFVAPGETGADLWNSAALGPGSATVVVATGNDDGGAVEPYSRALVALDPTTLAIRAAYQEAAAAQDLDFGTTPIFFRDEAGRSLVGAVEKNGFFYAYEAGSLAAGPVWQRRTGIAVGVVPAYDPSVGAGGTLFIAGDNGLLYGVDPGTGVDRWPPLALGFANGNMAAIPGLVLIGAGNGSVAAVDTVHGTLVRLIVPESPGPTYSGVVISNGLLYWMAGPYLNAWGVS